MKKKKGFICNHCGSPLKLISKLEPYSTTKYNLIIVCSRNKCVFQYKDKTDEKTEQYFIDNGGRVEDGS